MTETYVVDASVIMQYFIIDTYTPQVSILLNRLDQDAHLYVPEFCLLECANVFWKQVRFQSMLQTEAEQLLIELLALQFQIMPVSNFLTRALQIGLSHNLAIYDSFYIALAESLNCPLITVDQRQAKGAIASNVVVKPITDFV